LARLDGRIEVHRKMTRGIGCVLLLIIAGWAMAASAGETTCRVVGTMTFPVGQKMCIDSASDNWLACTDATAPSGGGAWHDTGVPCKEPLPKSPADYRPVPAGPQPATPPAEVKRVMDLFRGIAFRCYPHPRVDWSSDACSAITAEFVDETKAASILTVVVDPTSDDAAKRTQTEAAGLSFDQAIDWHMRFTPTDAGSVVMETSITGVQEVIPGIYDWRPLMLVSDTYLHPDEANARHALLEVKTDFPGQIKYLTDPR
jgi:hypothetical protein